MTGEIAYVVYDDVLGVGGRRQDMLKAFIDDEQAAKDYVLQVEQGRWGAGTITPEIRICYYKGVPIAE